MVATTRLPGYIHLRPLENYRSPDLSGAPCWPKPMPEMVVCSFPNCPSCSGIYLSQQNRFSREIVLAFLDKMLMIRRSYHPKKPSVIQPPNRNHYFFTAHHLWNFRNFCDFWCNSKPTAKNPQNSPPSQPGSKVQIIPAPHWTSGEANPRFDVSWALPPYTGELSGFGFVKQASLGFPSKKWIDNLPHCS